MRAFPVLCTAANQPPLSLYLSLSPSLSFSLSVPPFSVSVPSFYHSEALSVFLPFLLLSGSLYLTTYLSLSPSSSSSAFFLSLLVSLSLLPPYLLGQWQCVRVGGGIDLTLCCSSHRAVWHSAYVIQMSLKCVRM